ncbi:LysR family transcriptional regulator [Sphingomonas sp. IW22]|jgi:DNA-binding transcriptional LysR family regulator|uniref:LysR family transcriptional regulator n=1 Tax=Sphingomonas sp. IW22 TaxID=3242489 RepID=UPI0035218921
MELRSLRAFVEVVRQGGFSQAARTVFTTQSAVSKAVRQLEAEIGMPVLDRVGHRSTLTAAGEIVFRRATRMLAQREDMLAELEDLRGLGRGLLRLGLPPVGSSTLFAPLFAVYRHRYPQIDIRLLEHGSNRLEEILRAGEIDLGASLLPVSDEFEWQIVRREPLVALLPVQHPLAQKDTIQTVELKDMPFVLFESGFALNRIILDLCRRQGFEPEVVARSSQIDFIIALAVAELGVAFMPRLIAEQRPNDRIRYVPLAEPDAYWDIAMIWRRGAYLSHAAKAWLDLVKETHPSD